jgi:hypothetical protein
MNKNASTKRSVEREGGREREGEGERDAHHLQKNKQKKGTPSRQNDVNIFLYICQKAFAISCYAVETSGIYG